MIKKMLFDEQGLEPDTPYKKGQWKEITSHTDFEIKGFFGDFRFLSNFWPAKVFLDNEEYPCVENAYQAAKYPFDQRKYFKTCSAKEAIIYTVEHPLQDTDIQHWNTVKVGVMEKLLLQKFDQILNKELYCKLQETGSKFLEETNYWGDIFWGVYKTELDIQGEGENNLGKLLMKIRDIK